MRPFTIVFLMALLPVAAFRCDDENVEVNEGLEIELVTLDLEQNEGNEFSVEADVWLMLKATNHTDEQIDLSDFDFCSLMNDKNFLIVYKNNNGNHLVGRALPDEVACALLNISRVVPPNGSEFLVGGRWLDNPDNTRLSPGNYFSHYDINIKGKEHQMYVEFSVQ